MARYETDDMTFERWQTYWYSLNKDIFGEGEANKWLKRNLNHHTIMKKLWIDKGLKTYGDYRKWEAEHIEERNDYFRKRGDTYYDNIHTGGDSGWVPADGYREGGR